MPTVKLSSYEMHMLKQVVREETARHTGATGADVHWRDREGKALAKAVEKMDAARKAEVESILSTVRVGSVTPIKKGTRRG